jgi:hypothetical protein
MGTYNELEVQEGWRRQGAHTRFDEETDGGTIICKNKKGFEGLHNV